MSSSVRSSSRQTQSTRQHKPRERTGSVVVHDRRGGHSYTKGKLLGKVRNHTHTQTLSLHKKDLCLSFLCFLFFFSSLPFNYIEFCGVPRASQGPRTPSPNLFSSLGRTGPPFRQSRPGPSKHFGAKLELLFVTNILICRLSSSFFFSSLFLSIRAALPNATS